jgi:ribose transport system permease protein
VEQRLPSSSDARSAKRTQKQFSFARFLSRYTTLLVFVMMLVVTAFISQKFYSYINLMNVLRQSVPLGVVAFGLLFVILTGGIDLSVGSLLALGGVVLAILTPRLGEWGAIGVAMLATCTVGLLSGLMVSRGHMAPFVATLAMMTIARGAALIFAAGQPIYLQSALLTDFGDSNFLGVPEPVYLLVGVYLVSLFALKKTIFGRIVIAIGSNEEAVSLSGVRTPNFKLLVYLVSAFACGLAAVVLAARTGVGSPVLGIGFELDAIAAVVVGGASLSGGRGSAFNTLIGVLILSGIGNLMNLQNVPGYHQQIVKGLIIVIAVLAEGLKGRRLFRK